MKGKFQTATLKLESFPWFKVAITLFVMGMLVLFLPSKPIDPWNILNPKKIATMIFALSLVQAFGALLPRIFGVRIGATLSGFFGGLVSSTATTAELARTSKSGSHADETSSTLTFLSATAAMLFECAILLVIGITDIHLSLFLIFLGPLVMTAILIIRSYKLDSSNPNAVKRSSFEVSALLKLSLFIIAVLGLSKMVQKVFGGSGVLGLTFLVSLFEIHGSVIANVQLHDSGAFDIRLLGNLFAISIAASCLSKLFLVLALGSPTMKIAAVKMTAWLLLSLGVSWWIFVSFQTVPAA